MQEIDGRIDGDIEIQAHRFPWRDEIGLLVLHRAPGVTGERACSIGTNVTFERAEENDRTEPTMRLKSHEAQLLMDQLWDCGLRPSKGTGSAGAMAATEKHLGDMRSLVAHLLDFDGVR